MRICIPMTLCGDVHHCDFPPPIHIAMCVHYVAWVCVCTAAANMDVAPPSLPWDSMSFPANPSDDDEGGEEKSDAPNSTYVAMWVGRQLYC